MSQMRETARVKVRLGGTSINCMQHTLRLILLFKITITQCPVEGCGAKFYGAKTLKNHALTHTGDKPYECDLCGDRFTRIDSLRIHQDHACLAGKRLERVKKNKKPTVDEQIALHPCKHCDRKFRTELALSKHVKICRNAINKKHIKARPVIKTRENVKSEPPFDQGDAEVAVDELNGMTSDNDDHDVKDNNNKNDDDWLPTSPTAASNGEDSDAETDPEFTPEKRTKIRKRCTEIQRRNQRKRKVLATSRKYRKDTTIYPSVDPTNLKCTLCPTPIPFTRLDSWKAHYKVRHLNIKSHICPHCPKSFSSAHTLRNHVSAKHRTGDPSLPPRKTYACLKCGKLLASKIAWVGHQITICDVPFDLSTLPFKVNIVSCPIEGCPATFYTKPSLSKHIFAHTGEKPYSCEKCGTKFTRLESLKVHQDHVCKMGKNLNSGRVPRRKKLRKDNPDENPPCAEFPCPNCPRIFAMKHALRKHIEKYCTSSKS
ncbi:zinc finger protein 91-like isoform X1 [Folsomia candida]|uniref:zinc finger protein 91-like isoform X1 n=1 Tax=Folsomia candida TaxID=158441 RepID=UPI001604A474|nr:zinc finger protein 91-like isoform X1 [Folsomia candida]XP_035712289.1 zinc finger protein 91-like isoform X1 [Folsomia candida]